MYKRSKYVAKCDISLGNEKQDKECATNTFEPPEMAEAQAGNPLCPNEENNVADKRARRYIRITDIDSWRLIDEISQDESYSKSFNKIINDALFYGLPLLHDKLYGEVTLDEQPTPPRPQINGSRLDDELFDVIVKLLKETVLNVTINKSILSSLFHDVGRINKALNLGNDLNDLYEKGLMSDTPDYLYDYEISGLKKLRQ